MKTISELDRQFENHLISMECDNNYMFYRCGFRNCTFDYQGSYFTLEECRLFGNNHWTFSGKALETMSYLSNLWSLNEKDIINTIFSDIFNSRIPNEFYEVKGHKFQGASLNTLHLLVMLSKNSDKEFVNNLFNSIRESKFSQFIQQNNNFLAKAFSDMCSGNYDSALLMIGILIDSSGKKTYNLNKVGERFKKLIDEHKTFLFWIITQGSIDVGPNSNIIFDDGNRTRNLGDLLYDVRNSLVHEGSNTENIKFTDSLEWGIQNGIIQLPKLLLWAMVFMLISLPCNLDLKFEAQVHVSGLNIDLKHAFGNKNAFIHAFEKLFNKKFPRY